MVLEIIFAALKSATNLVNLIPKNYFSQLNIKCGHYTVLCLVGKRINNSNGSSLLRYVYEIICKKMMGTAGWIPWLSTKDTSFDSRH